MASTGVGLVISSGSALSVAANATSADQVQPLYAYNLKGLYTLYVKASATGLNVSAYIGGYPLVQNSAIPFTGTAGTISTNDNQLHSQVMAGGRAQLTFTNTTGGALTADWLLNFVPMK
jgi:hypothetical protein